MGKSQPIVIVAENQSSVWSGSVELFNAQNVVGGGEYDKTGETEIFTEKYKNQSTLPVQQDSQYGGNPYVQFDIGDDGATFETGKLVTIKVNGEDKKGIVKEYDDGNGNIIRGFGNPFLFNSTLYQDNGLDYFAFYEGEEEGQYISGTINNGASTFSFNLNESEVTADVDANGNWKYDIPEGVVLASLSFAYGYGLQSVDLSHIDTSQITDMKEMFYYCTDLERITFGNFSTESCENMKEMFYYCSSLTELDLSSFNTSNVGSMDSMFGSCSSLTNIIFGEHFDTSNVSNMHALFQYCSAIETIDISTFDTIAVTDMGSMFEECFSLKNLITGNGFVTSNVLAMENMFNRCFADREYFPKSLIENFDVSSVISMAGMFKNCPQPTESLDLSNWNVANVGSMWQTFFSWEDSDFVLNLGGWNTIDLGTWQDMFKSSASFVVIKTQGVWNEDITADFPNINWQNS